MHTHTYTPIHTSHPLRLSLKLSSTVYDHSAVELVPQLEETEVAESKGMIAEAKMLINQVTEKQLYDAIR